MNRFKVGVIGTGRAWEKLHYPAFQELTEEYEIRALCDLDQKLAEDWGRKLGLDLKRDIYTDYRSMIQRKDLQIIDILTPIAQNHPVAEVAARSGKSLILEKPMGATYEQALATRGLPHRYGIMMMIAENYRYSEEFNLIRGLIQDKKVGEPIFFIYQHTSCFPCAMTKDIFSATEWRQHPSYPGGDLLDAAIHNLAGIRHLFGGIKCLQAFGRPQDEDYSPYAVITVNIRFLNGVVGEFSYYPAGREPQRPLVGLRIFGTKGMIYLEDTNCGAVNVFMNDGSHELIPFRPMRGYYNELLNFYNALTGTETLSVTPDVEIGDLRTVYAILQSIAEEEIVRVDS